MRLTLRLCRRSLVFSAAAVLAACGGGGKSTPPAPTPTPASTGTTACLSVMSARTAAGRRLAALGAQPSTVPNRLYVSYRPSAGARATQSTDRALGIERSLDLAGTDGGVSHRVVTLAPGVDASTAAAALRQTAGVTAVEPVHYRYITQAVANDPLLDNVDQWYLFKTNVDNGAWTFTHGSTAVSVAVIDTGVDETNPDFDFDIKESIVNGVKTTGNGSVQDTDGHGTNVAGLATAQTNNAYGFAGVGYSTHLQAYKIFANETSTNPCPTADTADEAAAIRDAVANGASVINLSLGAANAGGFDQAEHDAVEFAIASNVTVVAAGGNEFQAGTTSGSLPDFPAAYPGVIAVGASAVQDSAPNNYNAITAETVASYSNSGVTLVAPGGDANGTSDNDVLHWIEGYSTTTAGLPQNRCSNTGGVCIALFNGTSQSTPLVAGTVALMEAFHGGARSLSPAQIVQLLTQTIDVLPGIPSTRQGAGRLDAGKAVAAAHP